jgi:GNAT superfamily N-acetyltransferase
MNVPAIAPYHADDLAAVVALLQATLPAEPITERSFARKVLLDPNFDPAGALVARLPPGEIIGFLLALARQRTLEEAPSDGERGWLTLFAVAPSARRQGVGTALLTAAEEWLRAQNRATVWVSPYAPNYWTPGVDEAAYPEALAFLQRRGYETSSRPLSMEVSLAEGWRAPEWVSEHQRRLEAAGTLFVSFEARHILPLTAFLRREFPGDWQRHLRETMLDLVTGRRPADELLLAVQEEQVKGFAQSEGGRFGPFGVEAAARGQGIGAVLLFRHLDGMRSRGHRNAWFLWTDDTTADRVYRAAGFRETRRYSVLRKSL